MGIKSQKIQPEICYAYSPKQSQRTDKQICLFYADLKKVILKMQKTSKTSYRG